MQMQHKMPLQRVPMGYYFWVLYRGGTDVVLVDCGFRDKRVGDAFGIFDHATALELMPRVCRVLRGVAGPGAPACVVRHIVLTHCHWDHCGGVADFPSARVWVREEELDWMRSKLRRPKSALRWCKRAGLRPARRRRGLACSTASLLSCTADCSKTETASRRKQRR